MNPGPILYTWSDDSAIAYQVTGDSDRDLVYLGPWGGTLEWNWRLPAHARYLAKLASFSRLVLYDQRGRGSSDRPPGGGVLTLEQRVDDLAVVLDAVNAYGPVLFAVHETTPLALVAAATRPWLISSLVLYDPAPVWVRTDDMPWEAHAEESLALRESVRRATSWDEWTRAHVRNQLPSLASDPQVIAWLAASFRAYAPPAATIAEVEHLASVDLRDILPTITLPTLVLNRPEVTAWPSETSRYVAERIPGARHVELPGRDTYPWAGEWEAVASEVEEFVTGSRNASPTHASDRSLATVLFTDVVGSTSTAAAAGDAAWRLLIQSHHAAVRSALTRTGGVELDTAGDGFFATFDRPARAVQCGTEIVSAVRELGLDVRVGIHTGEVETIDGKPGGIAVSIGARIAALAGAGEILLSSTVRDLVAGSGLEFADAGTHELRGVPGSWQLYRLATA